MAMEQAWKLEELISAGLLIEFEDYLAIENWLYKVYMALAPFPEERHMLTLACSDAYADPEEKIHRGLVILNTILDRSMPLSQHRNPMPSTVDQRAY